MGLHMGHVALHRGFGAPVAYTEVGLPCLSIENRSERHGSVIRTLNADGRDHPDPLPYNSHVIPLQWHFCAYRYSQFSGGGGKTSFPCWSKEVMFFERQIVRRHLNMPVTSSTEVRQMSKHERGLCVDDVGSCQAAALFCGGLQAIFPCIIGGAGSRGKEHLRPVCESFWRGKCDSPID
jgi:hypothetical protein